MRRRFLWINFEKMEKSMQILLIYKYRRLFDVQNKILYRIKFAKGGL